MRQVLERELSRSLELHQINWRRFVRVNHYGALLFKPVELYVTTPCTLRYSAADSAVETGIDSAAVSVVVIYQFATGHEREQRNVQPCAAYTMRALAEGHAALRCTGNRPISLIS